MAKKQVVWFCFDEILKDKDKNLIKEAKKTLKQRFKCYVAKYYKIQKGTSYSRKYTRNDSERKKKVIWVYLRGRLKNKDRRIFRTALNILSQEFEYRNLLSAATVTNTKKGILYSCKLIYE